MNDSIMSWDRRYVCCLTTLLTPILMLSACRTTEQVNHNPDPQALSRISFADARRSLSQLVQYKAGVVLDCEILLCPRKGDVAPIAFTSTSMTVVYDGGIHGYDLRAANPSLKYVATPVENDTYVVFGGHWDAFQIEGDRRNDPNLTRIIDSLLVLKQAALEDSDSLSALNGFEETARAYRAANPKPVLTEEAHRYMV